MQPAALVPQRSVRPGAAHASRRDHAAGGRHLHGDGQQRAAQSAHHLPRRVRDGELVNKRWSCAETTAAPLKPSRALPAPVQVEEYDVNTAELLGAPRLVPQSAHLPADRVVRCAVRKRRGKSALGRQQEWEVRCARALQRRYAP